MINCWIKASVVAHITKEAIRNFIRRLNFTQMVTRGFEAILYSGRQDRKEFLKPIDRDTQVGGGATVPPLYDTR
jgi:hypothetical protein|eukprot:6480612-Prymnesium_polylepis.1